MQNTHFIGIDVSKETLDYCVLADNKVVEQGVIQNNLSEIKGWILDLKRKKIPLKTALWCLEHTGVYGNLILQVLSKKKLSIWLENAVQIKLSQGMTRGKSDKIDAQRIAFYACVHEKKAKLYEPKRQVLITLQKLNGLRNVLLKSKLSIKKNISESARFLDKTTSGALNRSTTKALEGINKDITSIEVKMRNIVDKDDVLRELNKLIQSVDGVGIFTSIALLVTTNEFKDITCPIKYNCYAGLAPFNQQSGKSLKTRARVSNKANKKVKTLLHMAAISAIKIKESEFQKYYKRKTDEGKNGMTVINAIRAKIVARIFACVRDKRMYQRQYEYLPKQVA